jgi:hypothetical protein
MDQSAHRRCYEPIIEIVAAAEQSDDLSMIGKLKILSQSLKVKIVSIDLQSNLRNDFIHLQIQII